MPRSASGQNIGRQSRSRTVCRLRPRASQARKCARPARLLGEAGDRRPVDAGVPDVLQRKGIRVDEQVRRRGVAVEVEREAVGREDLAEGHRGGRPVDRLYERVVHAEVAQLAVDVAAERVPAHPRHERGAVAVPGRGDSDVGGAATEELLEGVHVLEAHPVVERVEVDAGAPDGDDVVGLTGRLRHRRSLPWTRPGPPGASVRRPRRCARPARRRQRCRATGSRPGRRR